MLAVIVDDNKQAAQDLAERLGDFDDVEIGGIALNGMDGLALVGQVQPDVLFLDVQLPDLSGLDFLEKMSSQTHGKCIRRMMNISCLHSARRLLMCCSSLSKMPSWQPSCIV